MNRIVSSLVGATLIAGVLYRPVGPTSVQSGNSGVPSQTAGRGTNPSGTEHVSGSLPATTGQDSGSPCTDQKDGPQAAAKKSLFMPGASADSDQPSSSSTKDIFSKIKDKTGYKGPLNGFIVTVPDPAHTRLALWFDRAVDSIVAAASYEGYNLDHFWLPWSDKPPEDEPDCHWRLKAKSEADRREQEPGLITFRKTPIDDQPSFLLVFLVGESPIYGIDKTQFQNAVQYLKGADAYSFCQAADCPEIDVVGPSFSGSASSLASAVESHLQDVSFSIISPTITDKDAISELEMLCCKDRDADGQLPAVCQNPKRHSVSFTHGLKEDSETWDEFRQYLTQQGLETGYLGQDKSQMNIGFISESETAYGHGFVNVGEGGRKGKRGKAGGKKENKGRPENEAKIRENPATNSPYVSFRFPRNISRLREAYGQNSLMAGSNNAANNPLPRQLLPMVLSEPESEGDSPPEFAKQQTPLSQEMEMADLSERLRQKQIRLAVIAATDPLDIIFVMEFLHRRDPDLQFAVFDSDLLFLRADDEVPPEGLLCVSPHPLLASREILGGKDSLAISSNAAQAVYDACLRVFEPSPAQNPGFSGPLWLTVVGRTGYWPVSLLDSDPAAPPIPQSLGGATIPRVWLVVWETVNFLSGLYILLFWLAQFCNRRALENFRLLDGGEDHFWHALLRTCRGSTEDDRAHRPYVMTRAFYLAISMFALWLIRALLLFPAIRGYGWGAGWTGIISALVFILLVFTTWILLVLLIVLAVGQGTPAGAYYTLITLLAVDAASRLGGWWWYEMTNPDGSYGLFLCYRSVSLTSGVSPVVPLALLLLAVGIWAWRQLDSMAVGVQRPYLPAARVDASFRRLDERIQATINHILFNEPAQALAVSIVALVWWITQVPQGQLMSVEPSSFTFCYQCLLYIVLWLVLDQWLRLCFVWLELRRVLERLEQLPFREAFRRLPKQFSIAAIWQQGGTRQSYKLLTRSLDSLAALVAEVQLGAKELAARLASLRKEFISISKSEASGTCPSHPGLRTLQESLWSIAETIAASLGEQQWPAGLSDSLENLNEPTIADQERQANLRRSRVVILMEEFLALRYTAYIWNTCIQMRNTLFFISAGFILTLLSVESYAFAQHRTLASLMVGVFVVLAISTVAVFVAMEKDSILSRLSNKEKEGISLDFVFRVATYGALPLFTVIASQFPSVSRTLFSWVAPFFQAVKP